MIVAAMNSLSNSDMKRPTSVSGFKRVKAGADPIVTGSFFGAVEYSVKERPNGEITLRLRNFNPIPPNGNP